MTLENDKLIQMQKANEPTAVDSKVTRELTDDNTMLSVRRFLINVSQEIISFTIIKVIYDDRQGY